MKTSSLCRLYGCIVVFFFFGNSIYAQLDTVHWIAPMHSRSNNDVDQFLYLSTPEANPFPVTISYMRLSLVTFSWEFADSTVMVSNGAPVEFRIGFTNYSTVLVSEYELNQPLQGRGIIASGPKRFYANLRVEQGDQAGSVTTQGRAAFGKIFRIGHLINRPASSTSRLSNFIGIIATEDNTNIVISDYTPGIAPQHNGNNSGDVIIPGNSITINLNAGESFVLSVYCWNSRPANANGLIGALVSSNKLIAVNCGSWWADHPVEGQDLGIVQVAPLERCGTEYVLAKGAGGSTNAGLETPIVVAHSDNTQVYLNGSTTPQYTLDAGESAIVPESQYTNGQNMYIKTSEPVFMYQSVAGWNDIHTSDLFFVPPLSCQIGSSVNNIPKVNFIGSQSYTGSIFIITRENCPPVISTTGTNGSLFGPYPVPGSPGYVTYDAVSYTGNLSVQSACPIQVGVLGRSGNRGWGGYYSGFDIVVNPEITITPNQACPDTLFLTKKYIDQGLSWYLNGQAFNPANDSIVPVNQPGNYMVIGGFKSFCEDVLYDTAYYTVPDNFVDIQTEVTSINCDQSQPFGQVTVTAIGNGPLEYSFDNGPFGSNPIFTTTTPGLHTVRVRNQQGCEFLRQVSLSENLPYSFQQTLCPGESVVLNGTQYDQSNPTGTIYVDRPGQCDSIVQVSLSFFPSYTNQINQQICAGDCVVVGNQTFCESNPTGTVTFQTVNGCDSLIEVQLTVLPELITQLQNTTCKLADTGTVVQNLQSWFGCDSTVVTTTTFQAPDSVYRLQTTCDPLLVGIKTSLYDCDSVVTVNTVLDLTNIPPPDYETQFTCDPNAVGTDTTYNNGVNWCDGITITSTELTVTQYIEYTQTTCDQSQVGAVTYTYNCDSVVTVTTILELSGIPTAQYQTQFTCDSAATGIDTTFNNGQTWCDGITVTTTELTATQYITYQVLTCNPALAGTEQLIFDCDSLVTINTVFNPSLIPLSIEVVQTCHPDEVGMDTTIYQAVSVDCDSLHIVQTVFNAALIPVIELFETDAPCPGDFGSILVEATSGGTAPFEYSLDGGAPQTDALFDQLQPGVYSILVSIEGCSTLVEGTVLPAPELTVTLGNDTTINEGTTIQLTPIVTGPMQTFQWENTNWLDCKHCLEPLATPEKNVLYTLVISYNGVCTATASQFIQVIPDNIIYFPTGLKPGSNTGNDRLVISNKGDDVVQLELSIFDRWGNAIYNNDNYPLNDWSGSWDSTYKGKPVQPGVYVAFAKIRFSDGRTEIVKWDVTVVD
ncbi:MAG: gliding motility-associated C-terminal domain-containing protein [Lewinellaceae bacterium]|nr:gliding motility-associated C-terminal domain-containing protein [Lewinellaceae bacterium]